MLGGEELASYAHVVRSGSAGLLAFTAVAAVACTTELAGIEPQVTTRVAKFDLPVRTPKKVDLLFVIDNSPAMVAHASKLSANLPSFMEVLNTIQGGVPSIHIGVVTTDLGTQGGDGTPGPSVPGCTQHGDGGALTTGTRVAGRYLVDEIRGDWSRTRNYTGTLPEAFTELATTSTEGCAYPRPLEAMRRALDGNPINAGFLRDEAQLAVIFITASDDCSFASGTFLEAPLSHQAINTVGCYTRPAELTDVGEYSGFLRSLKASPVDVQVGVIAGPRGPVDIRFRDRRFEVAPVCSDAGAGALPSPRLHALMDPFHRSTYTTICQPNLSDSLSLFASLPDRIIGDPCLESSPLDVEPATPGLQADCVVSYVFPPLTALEERLIPACTLEEQRPCWRIALDPSNCPGGHSELIEILPTPENLPPGTHIVGNCLIE